MPEISRFFGIVIRMYFREHGVPHFHAEYGEHEAKISIETLSILEGSLPSRAYGLVVEGASLHREELKEDWLTASRRQPLSKIAPLE